MLPSLFFLLGGLGRLGLPRHPSTQDFAPNKKASPQASERRACEGGSLKSKNA